MALEAKKTAALEYVARQKKDRRAFQRTASTLHANAKQKTLLMQSLKKLFYGFTDARQFSLDCITLQCQNGWHRLSQKGLRPLY